jgi:dTDP-4-amino-4,6-dideoxygalactose transaminase
MNISSPGSAKLAIGGGIPVRASPYPSWPQAGPEELAGLQRVLDSGNWSSSYGKEVETFEHSFAAYQDARYGICVNSGEAALILAFKALQVPAGSEVIVPAYTFVASATAVLQAGAVPVFVDVDPETYCISPTAIGAAIGPETSAIMPVHFAGLPADMDPIVALAERHGLIVIEDAAQAWGARYGDRAVGAIGDAGGFSFQASKNLTAGEGGIILTDDEDVAATCRSLADCGRAAIAQRYSHALLGGNHRMTEFQGAILRAQLDRYPGQLAHRSSNAARLIEALGAIAGVEPLLLPAGHQHSWHLFVLRIDPGAFGGIPKPKLVEALVAEGIPATVGYASTPYEQPLFENHDMAPSRRGASPVAERACRSEAIWIRHPALLGSEEDTLDVARALAKVQANCHELENLES